MVFSAILNGFIETEFNLRSKSSKGKIANSTALFPVNGNHEEARLSQVGTPLHDAAVFAGKARSRYFPVPVPDEFYSGYTNAGVWEFDRRRPNWELPIHQIMVENGVTIFFQGHDHLFVHQELDGIVYQSVPNPAGDTYAARNRNAYLSGDILDPSGYLNVTGSPDEIEVKYIRSYLPEDEVDGHQHGEVAYSYTVR